MLNTIDLFSGCGGLSLGFQNEGYNIIAAYDNWEPAIKVYEKNFSHKIEKADLASSIVHDSISKHRPDIIIGGPPCQDFSGAGLRDETLGRASLTMSFAEIILKSRPKFFVMENVCRVTNTNVFKEIVTKFKMAGYGLSSHKLDASYCGVPQARKRFFLVGHLSGNDGFLDSIIPKLLSKEKMSIYDYLGDSLGVEYYFRIPRSYTRRAIFSIYEPSVTIRGVERPIPKGYKRHPGDLVEVGPKVRTLTILERSYIQTFPKTFCFDGTKSDLNQMIGNAVPVNMAALIGKAIKIYNQTLNAPESR
ncbi:DNA cytosine methyltransferase [Pseudoalteromonas sp. meg-B1]|uniref:DNA cytosine methyltransferase n=1 Tax=Pseudoalteromonas sp. meg-B1 TaxID=2203192 RepID=UPI000D6FB705|nr:DNA cytosine methyltransferase [Pseudoalteromonas sp. meg-B1]PWS54312.1 DNA (cytosine-5-)-methyltransferase [Pseudoalteromonas sp. meg-B1]